MNKLNKNLVKYVACTVLGILIIVYFIYQVVQMNSSPYKTEVALERNVETVISTTAFVVRDEEYLVTENVAGTVVPIAEDGKRVGSGDNVAVVFQSPESAAAYVRINELNREIDYYKQLKNRVGIGTNAPSSYNDLIDDACIAVISSSREGVNSEFDESLVDLRDAVTARQLAVGTELSVDAKLSSLEAELITLQSQAVGYKTVTAPTPGYYIGSVDGYENAISYDGLKEINCQQVTDLINHQKQLPTTDVMGKLVDSFDWYLLCSVPYNSSGDIVEGETLNVNIPNTTVGTIKCTVEYKGDKEGEYVAVILKCNIMNREVANLRIEDIEIITEKYSGIRINNSAIREENGEKGVYVLEGNVVKFKRINIISSDETFSIIEKVDDSAYVKQYDTIITEGVGLYDGQVIY